ncbi:hypothetical protein [Arthrobacter sp. M4]|uniref:hypothetical protein n=1 Tax=Arthrobacter sp. M4 TaxID=218160 RepID=UPI001CDCCA49|nr:hypothetical protein [Arthrobacter sp. M4]MCA4135405.1 hypothetical protein [Arthrobacter sp. M4]
MNVKDAERTDAHGRMSDYSASKDEHAPDVQPSQNQSSGIVVYDRKWGWFRRSQRAVKGNVESGGQATQADVRRDDDSSIIYWPLP